MTRAGDENEADVSDDDVEEVPDPRPTSRSTSRSIPPPIPVDVRIKRTATQVSPPAVADNFRAQANELTKLLSATPDPQIAASLSYEIGEIWDRVSDSSQAIVMFTRALQHDPSLLPARWALHRTLYRERRWIELGEAIARAALGTNDSPELRFEAAHVAFACNDPVAARGHLTKLQDYLPALFELEQLVLGEANGSEVARVWLALADAVATPVWKLGFVVAAAYEAPVDAAAALARATTEAEPAWTTTIARARVASARSVDELDRALAELTGVLPESEERTAVRIRHTRLVRPGDAARAATLAPLELPFAERLELAAELHSPELVALLEDWQTRETSEARTEQIARWVADSLVDQSPWLRELLRAVQLSSPSTRALMSFAEVAALVHGQLGELASSYAAAAQTEGDASSTIALLLQAAWLQAEFGVPGEAAEAIRRAVELAPELAAVREIAVDVAEQLGDVALALAQLRIDAANPDPAALERAIRIAAYHDRDGVVLTLLYKLVDVAPNNLDIAWRLESELRFADDKNEHANLMLRLVEADKDPQRRAPLLVGAARLAAERGDAIAAIQMYRDATTDSDDPAAVAELHELLRRTEQWDELAVELVTRARRGGGRACFLEAASMFELALDSPARARDVYDEWHRTDPTDLTALTGLARTAQRVGDRAAACDASEKLFIILDTSDAGWASAGSLAALGKTEDADTIFFKLATRDDTVLSRSAAIVVLERAYETRNKEAQANALELVAHRMADVRIGAALLASAGWTHLVADRDFARAGAAFAAALAADPDNASAILGQLLVASDTKRAALGDACVAIAARLATPRAAASLYLRAAHVATAEGRALLATERTRAAFGVAPDEDVVAVTLAEEESQIVAGADPFAPNDAMLDRTALLVRRIAMTTDPIAIREWRYELALAHELADQPVEAGAVLAAILEQAPHEWRAIAAVRRIARHLKHEPTIAAASYALAHESGDRENRIQQFRVAIEIYDRTGSPFAFAAHRAIAALDPDAPEVERYLELARDDSAASLRAINARLAKHETLVGRDKEMVDLLVARAQLFVAIGQQGLAIADIDAVLEHAPSSGEALRLRAALAHEANDIDRAVALWWRYLALESPPYRDEVETLISQVQDLQESTGVTEDTHDAFDPELTKSDVLATEIALSTNVEATPIPRAATENAPDTAVEVPTRRTASIIRRQPVETEPGQHVSEVGDTTARVDLSAILGRERSQLRPDSDYDLEIVTNDASTSPADRTQPKMPLPRHGMTIRSAVGAADVPTIQTLIPLRVPRVDLDLVLPVAQPVAEPVLDARAFASRPSTDFSAEDSEVVMVSYSDLQPIATAESTLASVEEVEREIACSTAADRTVGLHCEAGRLALQLEDISRARAHFNAAVALDPHSGRAMRGLRRIAKREGDLAEVLKWLEPELANATGRERTSLARYRTDLLLALEERDLARIAVGEQLDAAPDEPESLVAQAVLCFLDDREADLRSVLAESLKSEPILRDGFRHLRALFGIVGEAGVGYESQLERFASADLASRANTLYELACHVEGADPEMAAALAVRAQTVELGATPELALQAVQLAGRAAPRNLFVVRASAETARRVLPAVQASSYFARWARIASGPDRAYAAAFAATADPQKFGRLWSMVTEIDPGNEYALYRQRGVDGQQRVQAKTASALDLDELLRSRRWTQLSKIVAEVPATDLRSMRLRAQVLHRRARATDATEALTDALDAWMIVLAREPRDSVAQGAALRLAKRLGPASELSVIAHVHAAATEPWIAASLAVAYEVAAYRLGIVHTIGNDTMDDPRRSLVAMIRAAKKSDLPGCARALTDRARFVAAPEAATIRTRAAAIALAGDDLALAASLATSPEAYELRAAIAERKRLPRPDPATTCAAPTLIYAAHRAQQRGDLHAALRICRQTLARDVDPIALELCIDVARQAGSADMLAICAAARKNDAELLAEAERSRGSLAAEARATQLAYEAAPWRFDLGLRLSRLVARQQLGPRRTALRIAQLADDSIVASDRAAAELALSALALRAPSVELSPMIKKASDDDPTNVLAAMFYDSTVASGREQLELEQRLAVQLPNPRTRAAFRVRAGRTAEAMGDVETAMISYADANYHAALFARYALALAHHKWRELADAAIAKASLSPTPGPYYLVAGTALMDQVGDRSGAIEALQQAMWAMPGHPEVFARLRKLLEETHRERELETLVETRIAYEPDKEMKLALMRSLAEHHYIAGAYDAAAERYRALVRIDPTDARAHAALVELASESGTRIATAIHSRLALEHGPKLLAAMHHRLATFSEPAISKRELEAALELDPDRVPSLHALADLAVENSDWRAVAMTSERIAALELDPALQARNFYRAARAYSNQRDDKRAKDMIRRAVDADPASSDGMKSLIQLARDTRFRDEAVDQISNAMRARIQANPRDGIAYRTLSRALVLRREEIVTGTPPAARAAAELAILFDAGEDAERELCATTCLLDRTRLSGDSADKALFAGASQPELRQVLAALGDVITKQIGPDPSVQSLGRKDRLSSRDPVYAIAREIATIFGIGAINVYVSSRPHGMLADPTPPISLVLGRLIAEGGAVNVRFATGAALKLAQLGLAVPTRLDIAELSVLCLGVVRIFQPLMTLRGSDERASDLMAKLKRSIARPILDQLAPVAVRISEIDMQGLARDLRVAGLRAGFAAAGSVLPGLDTLAAARGVDVSEVVLDPLARGLIAFALV